MISKENLKYIIELIQKQEEKERKFSNDMESVLDGRFIPKLSEDLMTALMHLFSISVEGQNIEPGKLRDESWLSWFVYETDYGKNPLGALIDGKEYVVTDIDSFYELLCDWKTHLN